ncbi:MAG: hypothetical protein ACRDRH_20150 [Pseudonocardia sp.]
MKPEDADRLSTSGVNDETVRRLLRDEPMASPGACILDRAWRFHDKILAR